MKKIYSIKEVKRGNPNTNEWEVISREKIHKGYTPLGSLDETTPPIITHTYKDVTYLVDRILTAQERNYLGENYQYAIVDSIYEDGVATPPKIFNVTNSNNDLEVPTELLQHYTADENNTHIPFTKKCALGMYAECPFFLTDYGVFRACDVFYTLYNYDGTPHYDNVLYDYNTHSNAVFRSNGKWFVDGVEFDINVDSLFVYYVYLNSVGYVFFYDPSTGAFNVITTNSNAEIELSEIEGMFTLPPNLYRYKDSFVLTDGETAYICKFRYLTYVTCKLSDIVMANEKICIYQSGDKFYHYSTEDDYTNELLVPEIFVRPNADDFISVYTVDEVGISADYSYFIFKDGIYMLDYHFTEGEHLKYIFFKVLGEQVEINLETFKQYQNYFINDGNLYTLESGLCYNSIDKSIMEFKDITSDNDGYPCFQDINDVWYVFKGEKVRKYFGDNLDFDINNRTLSNGNYYYNNSIYALSKGELIPKEYVIYAGLVDGVPKSIVYDDVIVNKIRIGYYSDLNRYCTCGNDVDVYINGNKYTTVYGGVSPINLGGLTDSANGLRVVEIAFKNNRIPNNLFLPSDYHFDIICDSEATITFGKNINPARRCYAKNVVFDEKPYGYYSKPIGFAPYGYDYSSEYSKFDGLVEPEYSLIPTSEWSRTYSVEFSGDSLTVRIDGYNITFTESPVVYEHCQSVSLNSKEWNKITKIIRLPVGEINNSSNWIGSNIDYTLAYWNNETFEIGELNKFTFAYSLGYLFNKNTTIKNVDLSGVYCLNNDMHYIFEECSNLVNVKLDNIKFVDGKKMYIQGMFEGCTNLTTISMKNWVNSTTDFYIDSYTFEGCDNLTEINMQNCSQTIIDKITSALTQAGIQNQVTIIT